MLLMICYQKQKLRQILAQLSDLCDILSNNKSKSSTENTCAGKKIKSIKHQNACIARLSLDPS